MSNGCRLVFVLGSALLFSVFLSAQNAKSVLVLQEGYSGQPGSVRFFEGLHEVFDPDVQNQIFSEYLDQDRVQETTSTLAQRLAKKYGGKKFDLIVGAGQPAMTFLLSHGEALWPGIPEIFVFVDSRLLPSPLPPNTTAIVLTADSGTTLDLALQLMPGTKRVFYVGGSSPSDKARRAIAEQDFKRFAGKIEFTYLTDLSLGDLFDLLGQLPADSIVIYGGIEQGANGHVYIAARLCPLIASASNVPVYGSYDTFIGCGIVGGRILDFKELGIQTAKLGIEVLERGTASGLLVQSWQSHPVVDWRQLQRWGISEDRLPAGTIVRFRTPSAWERYRWFVIAGLTTIVILLALIGVLILEMQRRKKADLAVKELSGRLINASEEERKRIARELHDDISQRLSMLAIEIDLLNRQSALDPSATAGSLEVPLRHVNEIIEDTHNLSHQLHSTKLEILGLEAALKELAQQLASQHNREIEIVTESIPSELNEDLALCFYRVAQEALHNSLKHSGSARVEVRVTAYNGILQMKVKDYGSGFDASFSAGGIGLATIRERLRLVGGTLVVSSRPGAGTEITAEVRLVPFRQPANSTSRVE